MKAHRGLALLPLDDRFLSSTCTGKHPPHRNDGRHKPVLSDGDRYLLIHVLGVTHRKWASLHIDFDYAESALIEGRKNLLTFPLLEHLVVEGKDDSVCDWGRDAPKLRHVEFRGDMHPSSLRKLPWDTIRVVSVEEGDVYDLLKMADGESATIEEIIFQEVLNLDQTFEGRQAHFPTLKSLRFENLWKSTFVDAQGTTLNDKGDLTDIMGVIKAPTLSELVIIAQKESPDLNWNHRAFLAMLQRSQCELCLQRLTLKRVKVSDYLLHYLRRMPSLRSLTWWDVKSPYAYHRTLKPFIKALAEEVKLVPDLRHLELEGVFPYDGGMLSKALERRKHELRDITLMSRACSMNLEVAQQLEKSADLCGVSLVIKIDY